MGRGPSPFKKEDMKRALLAAAAAGIEVLRVEIEQGKIVLICNDGARGPEEPAALDAWRANRGPR